MSKLEYDLSMRQFVNLSMRMKRYSKNRVGFYSQHPISRYKNPTTLSFGEGQHNLHLSIFINRVRPF